MGEPCVEHEGLCLAEGIDHAVQEANEERGVKAHRAGGIEQHDQPQRLDLAAPPGEINERATVRNIAMNGAAQIDPPPAAADFLAADQTGAHDAGEPCRQRVGRRNVVRINDVAQIGAGQRFNARRAFAAAAAVRRRFAAVIAPLHMIGKTERLLGHMRFGEPPRRGMTGRRRAGQHLPLPHMAALPEGIEDLVEALPIGMRGAK